VPGIPDLPNVNLCLLGSWIKRYSKDDEKQWKTKVDHKYNKQNPNIFVVECWGFPILERDNVGC
jgi:hypothetical protein